MAEGARLESVFRVKPNEGSNPSLSAKYKEPALRRFFCVYRVAADEVWRMARSSLATLLDFSGLIYLFFSTPIDAFYTSLTCPLSDGSFHIHCDYPMPYINNNIVFTM